MLKRNKLNVFVVLLLLLSPFFLLGQNSSSTSSPYSRYAFGNLSGNSFGRGDGMGGIGIGTRNSIQVNTANPASYTAIDSLTFLMQFGLDAKVTYSETNKTNNFRNNVNFNHLTFAMPIKRWWAGSFGLIPFSSKGYNVKMIEGTDLQTTNALFTGSGSLTKFYVGNAFRLGKHLSIGVNTWFLFGRITDNVYIYYPNDANAYDYMKDNSLTAHGFGITGGLQYQFDTKKHNRVIFGLTYEPMKNIASDYTIYEERMLFRSSSSTTSITDTLQNIASSNKGLQLPMTVGAGFSYIVKGKLTMGADYKFEKWKDVSFLGSHQDYLTNSSRFSAGLEYIPNQYSIRSYWERTNYRLGAYYEKSYITLNGYEINGYGLTFGLGLPISRPSFSLLNISAEFGKLGTTQNNLIRETYGKITFHVLLHDRWFFKRKFD